jgi:hypothetical protein
MKTPLIPITREKPSFRQFFNPNDDETLDNKRAQFIEAGKLWRAACYVWRKENLHALPFLIPSRPLLEVAKTPSSPFLEWLKGGKGRGYLFFLCVMLGIFIVNQFVYWLN